MSASVSNVLVHLSTTSSYRPSLLKEITFPAMLAVVFSDALGIGGTSVVTETSGLNATLNVNKQVIVDASRLGAGSIEPSLLPGSVSGSKIRSMISALPSLCAAATDGFAVIFSATLPIVSRYRSLRTHLDDRASNERLRPLGSGEFGIEA